MGEKWSNHTVYNINYHFVWCRQSKIDCLQISDLQCPKYRHSVLDEIEQSLETSFREVCDEYNYEILSLHISPDHVHLFLSAHPKHSPSEIARKVKSITARKMWKQHESLLTDRQIETMQRQHLMIGEVMPLVRTADGSRIIALIFFFDDFIGGQRITAAAGYEPQIGEWELIASAESSDPEVDAHYTLEEIQPIEDPEAALKSRPE